MTIVPTTLPQPALANLGMNWLVRRGSLDINAAFTFADEAAAFAKDLDDNGMRVAVGHTTHGWHDMLDLREPLSEVIASLHAFEALFIDTAHD